METIYKTQNISQKLITIKNPFTFICFPERKLLSDFWKIHISCTYEKYPQLLDIVIPYLIQNKINFKFINDRKNVRMILSELIPEGQLGKF